MVIKWFGEESRIQIQNSQLYLVIHELRRVDQEPKIVLRIRFMILLVTLHSKTVKALRLGRPFFIFLKNGQPYLVYV